MSLTFSSEAPQQTCHSGLFYFNFDIETIEEILQKWSVLISKKTLTILAHEKFSLPIEKMNRRKINLDELCEFRTDFTQTSHTRVLVNGIHQPHLLSL